jgi:ATP-dependent helicase/nuclease subunit A
MLVDLDARVRATDPTLSCIVQAPAGSGKTEILTQRFLRLLSTVALPEHIVALTFTRKAANEMRERILLALQRAAQNDTPTSAHQQTTHRYATEALANDKARGWQLLDTPARLRVTTIDSLCQTLAQAIPLTEKQTPYARITDTPHTLYLAAARACLSYAIEHAEYNEPLKILLEHLDNRQDRLLAFFCEQLSSRDQWQRLIYPARLQDKTQFEDALRTIEHHEIARFKASIPAGCIQTLIDLSRQLACIEANPESIRHSLCHWTSLDELDNAHIHGLSSLLLTAQGALRQRFDHHVGLRRDACSSLDYKTLSAESKILLSDLNHAPGFLDALLRVKRLPPPHYPVSQWATLQALFVLLPLLHAHLQVTFNQSNEVDFSAIAHQAHLALRDHDAPTDLALYLDSAIHHLLIDEFQDTSMQQFELITQLVEGFEANDGKTVFIVGDPMQSIYRFRGAEVGLFLRAQRQGIGPVPLTPLQLRCNFRATETLVEWINHRFIAIFPDQDDLESGAISFHQATPVHFSESTHAVHAYSYPSREEEARAIAHLAKHDLATYPTESIAILVRSRRQLTPIIKALRAEHIPYQGIDIDWIATLPHIRDVWSLTEALLMPANRLAWLSLLRSPWCGLSLADVFLIANVDKHQSILKALANEDLLTQVSPEGRIRLCFLHAVFTETLARRHQQPLVEWLMTTLHHLHADALLSAAEKDDLEQYWRLIESLEQDGQLPDLVHFKTALDHLYSKQLTPSKLQIMTIHKAKGLEFDRVILPSLSAKTSSPERPLLRWLTLPTTNTDPLVLVSPLQAAHHDPCPLYDYLGKLDQEKSQYEQQRLLYVAVTRAKKQLYLFDHTDKGAQGTFRSLLHQEVFIPMNEDTPQALPSDSTPALSHLPVSFYTAGSPSFTPTTHSALALTDNSARMLGIIAHDLLHWICTHHPKTDAEIPWALAKNALQQSGFDAHNQAQALERIAGYLTPLFQTPRGQWLIQAHRDERNEYELLVLHHGEVHTRIIDRTFYENGICWIIDFKTGREDALQESKHRTQVNAYAAHLADTTQAPIHCGLYYLNTQYWVEWAWELLPVNASEPYLRNIISSE